MKYRPEADEGHKEKRHTNQELHIFATFVTSW